LLINLQADTNEIPLKIIRKFQKKNQKIPKKITKFQKKNHKISKKI